MPDDSPPPAGADAEERDGDEADAAGADADAEPGTSATSTTEEEATDPDSGDETRTDAAEAPEESEVTHADTDEEGPGKAEAAHADTAEEAPEQAEPAPSDTVEGATEQADATADSESTAGDDQPDGDVPGPDLDDEEVPDDVQKYDRFKKVDGAQYERVNEFLRDRTYITAREWALARLCADFRTETGVEMTKIGENLPYLVPFMTDTYSPQAVNQARAAFEEKVRTSGSTFLYGAMSGFFTAEELDDLMYEVTETAKFLLEVEGTDLAVGEELDAEDRISDVMREVRESSAEVRGEEVKCPECGHVHEP